MSLILAIPKTSRANVRQEGQIVVLEIDGSVATMPWEAAIQLGEALMAQGRRAEEVVKHEQIQQDQAVLTRIGFPCGVTSNPKIQEAAERDAQWDSNLRKKLPGGVRARARLGTPALRRMDETLPKKGKRK